MGLGDWNAVCCRGKVDTLLPIRQAESVLLSAAFRGFGTTSLGHSALVVMVPVSRRFCVYDVSLLTKQDFNIRCRHREQNLVCAKLPLV